MFSNPLGFFLKDFFVRGLLCGTKYAIVLLLPSVQATPTGHPSAIPQPLGQIPYATSGGKQCAAFSLQCCWWPLHTESLT